MINKLKFALEVTTLGCVTIVCLTGGMNMAIAGDNISLQFLRLTIHLALIWPILTTKECNIISIGFKLGWSVSFLLATLTFAALASGQESLQNSIDTLNFGITGISALLVVIGCLWMDDGYEYSTQQKS